MLTAILDDNYYKNGRKIYVYLVSGSAEELEAFKAAKGTNYRQNDKGQPLHFVTEFDANGTKRLIQPKLNLKITVNNNIVVDELKEEQRLMKEIYTGDGGGLAGEIRKQLAARWVQQQQRPAAQPAVQQPAEQQPIESPESILDKTIPANTAGGTIAEE